ncbi:MAG: AraC family transcriptional regulator [Eubacteriales bacterium]|nr:AraC family transcriptional regulator [Eubacteriales bacterium]
MLHRLNASELLGPEQELHYAIHDHVEPETYPQVHDFYELALVVSGHFSMRVGEKEMTAGPGTLLLLRPGEVHSRSGREECIFINIAFPAGVMEDMFAFLRTPRWHRSLLAYPGPLLRELTAGESLLLQTKLERLNLLPARDRGASGAQLRFLLMEVLMGYLLPFMTTAPALNLPGWLAALLTELEEPENFSWELGDLSQRCGRTEAHVCRSFKKHLGVTPWAYIQAKRLNYAANLLLHTDKKVIDIAYAAGFQSPSRFYHAFKQEFSLSPLQYRHRGRKE